MLLYIIKRILWFIPTLFAVTLIGFILLANSPGDPVNAMVNLNSRNSSNDIEQQKKYWRKQLGLDLPVFYFSVSTLAEPDTLYKIYDAEKLKTYKALLKQSGNAKMINNYLLDLKYTSVLFNDEISKINADTSHHFLIDEKEQIHNISVSLDALKQEVNEETIKNNLETIYSNSEAVSPDFNRIALNLKNSYNEFLSNRTRYKNYIPKINWYGFHNQYHRWLFGGVNSKGIIRGDFGISYVKKEPVIAIIKDKMIWSLCFSILSIILAYAVSIPIGIKIAEKPNARSSRISQYFFFILYSMPSFFVGVLLLMLFANPDVLSVFPPSGIKPIEGYASDANLFQKIIDSLPYMILPLICYTYSSLAFISRITTIGINEQLQFDYIKTARAKGLSEKKIIWKHAFKNSLLPLITVFTSVFPTIIGGSVIIESIFTIPGMGLETVRSILSHDYPVVIAIVTLSALLTIFSYLLADILYAWADPRIRNK